MLALLADLFWSVIPLSLAIAFFANGIFWGGVTMLVYCAIVFSILVAGFPGRRS